MANWTGNAYVDALLLGEKWDTTNLTYFLKGGSSTWNTIETNAMEAALQSWADVANITFTEVFTEGAANLVEDQFSDSAGLLGLHQVHNDYTTSTITTNGTQLSGNYNYNGYGWDETNANGGLQVGGLGYLTLVHELGHALGLDHTHSDGGGDLNLFPGVSSSSDSGNNQLNQDIYSAMSYVHGLVGKSISGVSGADNYGFIAGPMAFDIATIQYLYGANTAQNTGNNTYILPDTNEAGTYFSAIWDAGGTDEIVYQGTSDTTIDLRSATLADEIGGGGFLSSASGVTGGFTIAGDYTNALADVGTESGVIIENASGGSGGDTITGNNVANKLLGNAGKDNINAQGGDDIVIGGLGADTIYGSTGSDTLYGDQEDGSGTTSGISSGSGQVTKSAGNNSIANAQDVSTAFSTNSDSDIADATTTPHVSVNGTGDGNIDYYKVTINNAGTKITLDIDHGNEDGSNATDVDTYIQLLQSDGTVLAFDDDSQTSDGAGGSDSTNDSYLTYTFAAAGTYYIAVGAYSSGGSPAVVPSGDTYELQISVDGELNADNDTLYGEAGNDTLYGGAGDNTLNGGTGNDTALFDFARRDASFTATTVSDGSQTDTVDSIEGRAFQDASYGGTFHSGNAYYFDINGDDSIDVTFQNDNLQFYLASGVDSGTGGLGTSSLGLVHGGSPTFTRNQTQFSDINGDGRYDAVFQGLDNRFWANYGTDNSYSGANLVAEHGGPFSPTQVQYADANGDNRSDLIFHGIDNRFWINLGNESGFGGAALAAEHGGTFNPEQVQYADVNGDGSADLIFQGIDNRFWINHGTGAGFGGAVLGSDDLNSETYIAGQAKYADINGDGSDDMIFQDNDNNIFLSLASGNVFGAATLVTTITHDDFNVDHIQLVDMNNDGNVDMMYQGAGNEFWFYESTGTGFEAGQLVLDQVGSFIEASAGYGDLNGDGAGDIIYQDENNSFWTSLQNNDWF